jgi:hypothetical protein
MKSSQKWSFWVAASAATFKGPIKRALAPDAPAELGLRAIYEMDSFEIQI